MLERFEAFSGGSEFFSKRLYVSIAVSEESCELCMGGEVRPVWEYGGRRHGGLGVDGFWRDVRHGFFDDASGVEQPSVVVKMQQLQMTTHRRMTSTRWMTFPKSNI